MGNTQLDDVSQVILEASSDTKSGEQYYAIMRILYASKAHWFSQLLEEGEDAKASLGSRIEAAIEKLFAILVLFVFAIEKLFESLYLFSRWLLMATWWPERGDFVAVAHGVEKVDGCDVDGW
ncbi:hypothetical protein LR48_Vigan04g144500 [Vigna angularis]|uniref:Uncharacterized protein n=1 Tax=Phaseolus angularis TaxID=3914 RepID=A0A0L9UFA1_PHAAN|nr:hypothetical protein LR48_Vigan04g144500 [Vigna angularis]